MSYVWNKGRGRTGCTYEIVTRVEGSILIASLFAGGKFIADISGDASVIGAVELPEGVFYANPYTACIRYNALLGAMVRDGYLERVDGFPEICIEGAGKFYNTYRVVDR